LKKIISFSTVLVASAIVGIVYANPKAPRCATAGPGETNNGICFNTRGAKGEVNGSHCMEPESAIPLNCIF